jgi:hypothetical protein
MSSGISPETYDDREVWDGIITGAHVMASTLIEAGVESGRPESVDLAALRAKLVAESVDDILNVPGIDVDTESFRLALWFVLGPITTVLGSAGLPSPMIGLCIDAGAVYAEASRRIDDIRAAAV